MGGNCISPVTLDHVSWQLIKYEDPESVNNSFQCSSALLFEYFKAALWETKNTVADISRQASPQKHHSPGETRVNWFLETVVTASTSHAHSDHTEIGGMSCFVSTEARLACHLRLTVGCFSVFQGQDQKCQYSLLQEERWRWFTAGEQSHRILIASKTSLENLPRSCLGVLTSSLFCKYIAKGLHSFVLVGLGEERAAGKSALLSGRSLGTTIAKSCNNM